MPDKDRKLTAIDRLIAGFDHAVKTVSAEHKTALRESPAQPVPDTTLDDSERRHISGLMRVNHTGEVCAQALYLGQAVTARDNDVRQKLHEAAVEEEDHLAWCEERLHQLNSRPSVLNPVFYGLSFGLGALTGLAGDKISMGFVAATEDQVCEHLQSHLEQLPEDDQKSHAILSQMLDDEARHASKALDAGGVEFKPAVKSLMSAISTVMTKTTYRV